MIRIAAAGDVHFGEDSAGMLRPHLEGIADRADALLLAGDLTRCGEPAEAKVLAEELRDAAVPTVAVLGNHDHHAGREGEVRSILEDAGVRVLEGEGTVVGANGSSLGVAGTIGFGGGFAGACASDFGEREMKSFIGRTRELSSTLEARLRELETDVRVALLHYAPVDETLRGERLEIYPFLGSYLLGEAIDRGGADLALHGHAHGGVEKGVTPGGVRVRNVSQPVIKQAFALYCFSGGDETACEPEVAATA